MPRYTIPQHPGKFHVERHYSGGHYLVLNKGGRGGITIPVRDKASAEALCEKLNKGEHNGTVSVPSLKC